MTSEAIVAAVQRPAVGCAHGVGCHDGAEPAVGTAPETARSWLLIEHDGPWPAEAADAALPGALAELAAGAGELGVRVQLIRRPGRRRSRTAAAPGGPADPLAVFAGWAAGSSPWLRRGDSTIVGGLFAQLADLADGMMPSFGSLAEAPLYLVCTHGRRDACCARLGAPLARALAAAHPAQVWETTHVGGHRYAANLVMEAGSFGLSELE